MVGRTGPERATCVGRPKPSLVPSHRNLAIDWTSYRDDSAQEHDGRRANHYLSDSSSEGGSTVIGKVGTDLTLAIHKTVLPDIDRRPGPSPYLERLVAEGIRVHSVAPHQLKLEDVFLRLTKGIVQ